MDGLNTEEENAYTEFREAVRAQELAEKAANAMVKAAQERTQKALTAMVQLANAAKTGEKKDG